MSRFKKLLAKVGIGAATVDARLFDDVLIPGELLNGEVNITGGDVEQEIDDIYLYIATTYKREVDDTTVTEECILVKYRLSERFNLQPREAKVIPFSFPLPDETPLTMEINPFICGLGWIFLRR